MLTIKDGKKILTTPVSAEDLKDIHIGDVVYLNGDLTTCRDVAHRRLVEEGRPLPVDVKDAAIFHAGPIIRPLEDDKFEMDIKLLLTYIPHEQQIADNVTFPHPAGFFQQPVTPFQRMPLPPGGSTLYRSSIKIENGTYRSAMAMDF